MQKLWPQTANGFWSIGCGPEVLKRADAKIDLCLKAIAPSTELRKWYAHDPEPWEKFQQCYRAELHLQAELLRQIRQMAEQEKSASSLRQK